MRYLKIFGMGMLAFVLTTCATLPPAPPENVELGEDDPAPGEMLLLVGNLPDLIYQGMARKDAKLDMVPPKAVSYSSITAVTSLPIPALPMPVNVAPRTGVENNYASFSAYLYAFNLPVDNDFHLILGDTPTFQSGVTNLINVEISGRPNSTDTVFRAVRNQFLAKIGNPSTLPQSVYQCLGIPIAITVSGGPFWDTSHPKGGSGTKTCNGMGMYTQNGWELHPVTAVH